MTARKVVYALLASLLLVPSARAAGISLRWDKCFADGGLVNKTFACNTNIRVEQLVGSFVLPQAVAQVEGVQVHLEITTASASLPAWWDLFNSGACRPSSLSTSLPSGVACVDWSGGFGSVNIFSYTVGSFGPATVALRAVTTVQFTHVADLSAGQEYTTQGFGINHAKTLGFPSCAGCSTPACIYLRSVELFGEGSATPLITLTAPANGTDGNTAIWQGGAGVPPLPGGACSGSVPVRNSTWGAVKTLYR